MNSSNSAATVAVAAEPTIVDVAEVGREKFLQSIRMGLHIYAADEPQSAGGGDAAPGPYDFLLAALGACTNMTLRKYADIKKLPLTHVRVRLSHRKVHAQDCADCQTRDGKVDEITRDIELEGELTEAQRLKFLEIANKCPVHRTLTSEIKVRSRLFPAAAASIAAVPAGNTTA